jgi:hypothetical protein
MIDLAAPQIEAFYGRRPLDREPPGFAIHHQEVGRVASRP